MVLSWFDKYCLVWLKWSDLPTRLRIVRKVRHAKLASRMIRAGGAKFARFTKSELRSHILIDQPDQHP